MDSLFQKLIHKQKVMETAFNYYIQRSSVDDQKIDCSIISMGFHQEWAPLKEMHRTSKRSKKRVYKFIQYMFINVFVVDF